MGKTIIKAKNLTKAYISGQIKTKALKNVSLEIKEGDFLTIVGRNGSGKSTLLRQLGLLDKPDSGEIFFGDKEVIKMSESERSDLRLRNIGYVFQEFALVSDLSAVENVMMPKMMLEKTAYARKKAEEVLDKLGLFDKRNRTPSELSGGEQQKVAIARSLINDPEILFADEPTANLDSIAAKEIIKTFKKLNEDENHTIIMITHEHDEVNVGNRKIELVDGKVKNE